MKTKKILALVSALALASTLFACKAAESSSSSKANSNSSSTSSEPSHASSSESGSHSEVTFPAPEKTTFNLGHLNSTAHLLGFVAKEEGFFEEEGLNVELTLFKSAAELSSGLTSEQLDAAFIGSVPTLSFQSNGQPLTIFGGAMTNGHGYAIKSKYTEGLGESDINISLLKGKKVATTKPSVQDLELQVLLTEAGLTYSSIEEGGTADKSKDVTIVYFKSQTDAYTAFASDEIDAVSIYSPYASRALSEGHTIIYYCSDLGEFENQPCCRQVAFTDTLNKYPNAFTAFERALIRAYKFTQENQDKTVEDVEKYITINADDPAKNKELIKTEVYGGYAFSVPDPDKKGTVALKDSAVEFGYFGEYDIDSFYNTDIYKTALDQLIEQNPSEDVYKTLITRFSNS